MKACSLILLVLACLVPRSSAEETVSAPVEVGGGDLVIPTDAAFQKNDPKSNASTTVWSWPNEMFYPNQGKMYVAGQGCPSGRSPAGCGCLNGDFNVPVVAQAAVTTRRVSGGSCMCTYWLPAGFPATTGLTIQVQTSCL